MAETSVDVNAEIVDLFTAGAVQFQQALAASRPDLPNVMRRGAHPKHHGLVRAVLTVPDQIPEELRFGLFAQPRSSHAYVRFSNSTSSMDDAVADAHGMAIKLFDVPGEKLLQDEIRTHDFVLVDGPNFVASSAEHFMAFMKLSGARRVTSKQLEAATQAQDDTAIAQHRATLGALEEQLAQQFPHASKLMRRIANPLTVAYFSQTAYRLGSSSVKYQLRPDVLDEHAPTDGELSAIPDRPNYLAAAMTDTLATRAVRFDFLIQRGDGSSAMPVEDPTVVWSEDRSPFVKVATLTIPQQTFTIPSQRAFAETIEFNAWHALADHEPLGRMNQSRREIYSEMARRRRVHNGVPHREPDGRTDF